MTEDDQTAETIAELVASRIEARYPSSSARFRRRLVALYTAQALGEASPPGEISAAELAAWLHIHPQRVHEAFQSGLARAWKTCRQRYPELRQTGRER